MSTNKPRGKKTVVVTKKSDSSGKKEKLRATTSRTRTPSKNLKSMELLYGVSQYKFFGICLGLIALGMLLMLGGSMPSPDVWDDSLIFSFRRTVLAPVCILAGLLVGVYAIFKD
jgi:hypothetical protein